MKLTKRNITRAIGAILLALLFGLWPLLLHAATCAHTETGLALDPAPCSDVTQYLSRFNNAVTASWSAVTVPDGTQHGAKATCSGGNCSYTNPPVVAIPPTPAIMNKLQFQQFSYTQLGAIASPSGTTSEKQVAGITRFGQILLALKSSTDPGTAAALDGYNNNTTFDLDYVEVFLALVGPTGSQIISSAEASAIIGNWPSK